MKKIIFNLFFILLFSFLFSLVFSDSLRLLLIHTLENNLQHTFNNLFWSEWIKTRAFILILIFFFLFLVFQNWTFKKNPFLKLENFYHFILTNRGTFALSFLVLYAIYGKQLYILSGRLDAQTHINNNPDIPVQFYSGRYGDYLLRLLLEGNDFTPYYANVLAFFFLALALILFAYCCKKIGNMSPIFSSAIFCLFLTHPIWIEQFYFHHQMKEIIFALCLILILLFLIYKISITPPPPKLKLLYFFSFIFLFVLIYSTYQSLVILYFSCGLFFFILFYQKTQNKMLAWRFAFYGMLVFIFGFICNEIIIQIYLNGEVHYLKQQICWGKNAHSECIKNIILHIYNVSLGNLIIYGLGYGLTLSLAGIVFLKFVPRPKWPIGLALLLLALAPFILTFYAGNTQVARSQLTLPFVIAAFAALSLYWLPCKHSAKIVAYVALLLLFLNQMHSVLKLTYSEDLRTQNDIFLAHAIESRLSQQGWNDSIPVAFVGSVAPRLNHASAIGHYIGLSITEFGQMYAYMQSMGFGLKEASAAQKEKAWRYSPHMPSYPAEGFVHNFGDFYAVKLGEPKVLPKESQP